MSSPIPTVEYWETSDREVDIDDVIEDEIEEDSTEKESIDEKIYELSQTGFSAN